MTDADPAGRPTVASELDDALYYLRHDCEPCAERHFELARRLGATDEMIARVRTQANPDTVGQDEIVLRQRRPDRTSGSTP